MGMTIKQVNKPKVGEYDERITHYNNFKEEFECPGNWESKFLGIKKVSYFCIKGPGITKLGIIEDLLDKYGIKFSELEEILSRNSMNNALAEVEEAVVLQYASTEKLSVKQIFEITADLKEKHSLMKRLVDLQNENKLLKGEVIHED